MSKKSKIGRPTHVLPAPTSDFIYVPKIIQIPGQRFL